MANNTIAVLRQMLASLDDAKKYQSLRDVMSTMNAPDLAAVFEDLPEEKMPVLFRLCPKDLAADVFAELSSETQEALIRGLTDRELKSVGRSCAWMMPPTLWRKCLPAWSSVSWPRQSRTPAR